MWGFTEATRFKLVQTAPDPVRAAPSSVDRSIFMAIHGLPHTPYTDRYGSMVSDVGEGLGWVVAGAGIAWLAGSRGRRPGIRGTLPSLSAPYPLQRPGQA